MNHIEKKPISTLGYHFIPNEFLPAEQDEYYLRNCHHQNGIKYRNLLAFEIESLVRNRNTSDDWNKLLVSDAFNPELVKNCKFYGLIRIGKLEPYYLEFKNLRMPVGLYNSTIISCDFGDNVVVSNVHYISHYIVEDEVMLVNVNEIAATNYAKFGNGIVKEGEQEKGRIWLEVCNENAGRGIIPFDGMLPGDAFIWSRYRNDEVLQQKLKQFTEDLFDRKRGHYGRIGKRTVIKSTRFIKDALIGSDAYIKGANKLKNITINSSAEAQTQIGEGVELVNGVVGYGCRIFYGVKAVRFITASHSQLKYGARLINSYLGNNATISCCEVLNSLIFPAHEQHHNNSFLCAALLMGQSNMAEGATIGSNHNSRSADGELIAGRGFWPGLCVSLKHNSRFASFSLIAKGSYPAELDIPIPFSLITNDVTNNMLVVMPGYWFFYNMYALARNAWKYVDRDHRTDKTQLIEYDYLAPDTINEILSSLDILRELTGLAWYKKMNGNNIPDKPGLIQKGEMLLQCNDPVIQELQIEAAGFENTSRKTILSKVLACYHLFKELVVYHAGKQMVEYISQYHITDVNGFLESLSENILLKEWKNIGGQLIPEPELQQFIQQIHRGRITGWDEVHQFYAAQQKEYPLQKLVHALAAFENIYGDDWRSDPANALKKIINESVATREWMTSAIETSRKKDYRNPFRQMVYENSDEMNKVIGCAENNSFVVQEKAALELYKKRADLIINLLNVGSRQMEPAMVSN